MLYKSGMLVAMLLVGVLSAEETAPADTTAEVENIKPTPPPVQEEVAPPKANLDSKKVKIMEDKINYMESHKLKELEARIHNLEKPKKKPTSQKDLTPLAKGNKTYWGIGQGVGIATGSVHHNASIGVEVHLFKVMLPQFERPMTHPGALGIAVGVDSWFNTGIGDNENFGYSPYLKITGNSLVFENYIRVYGSLEPVLVFGYATSNQDTEDFHFGFRGLFGAEFFASKNYNFFAEVGVMKTNSVDGTTEDTGLTPVIKAGPRFWF